MPIDIRTMDLNLLKALDALLDERNVTRAANRLALTQPAVSGMLTRLRECFDDPLFTRTQRGIVPTLRALELAAPVKQILAEVNGLLQPKAFDPASAEMTFTIAATDYALRAVVVPYMEALRKLAPGIRVAVVPVNNDQLTFQFERGDIDIALITPDTTPPDLHARALYDEEYVCLLRRDHPAAQGSGITLEDFCILDHALVSYHGGQFHGVTDDALAALGKSRRVALSVSSFLVLPEILRVSDLIAVVPRRLAVNTEDLRILPPPLSIPGFTKNVAWHERTHRDAGYRWLRGLMFDTVAT
ncbi:LysR family transcriptional regulator [Pantoea cypripedii]|uniref:Transcriptional regulator n=1 Tax=Pantoea cypripedii TaxID=55209 RepID=A0A1X1EGI1_PANCY|nr:LysR family transcriptional regulator [Pantoea cypripedii]MBP2199658.1 DNA-binding transcriptional LysR family regulator [Pantoea cypripedii]ORM88067.1 transcriptional regulator [Pantoea cypripedii]